MSHNFIVPSCDTDAIGFCKPDFSPFTEEEQAELLIEINNLLPPLIQFSHDGIYLKFIVIRAKNYVMKYYDKKKDEIVVKVKGSGLRASMKEARLKTFLREVIQLMIDDKLDNILDLYNDYAYEILNITDILPWSFRKTVTEKLQNGKRTNEISVWDAIKHTSPQPGDKLNLYFNTEGLPQLASEFTGNHHVDKLLEKLYRTIKIFEQVLDISKFPNYKLKKQKQALQELVYMKEKTTGSVE